MCFINHNPFTIHKWVHCIWTLLNLFLSKGWHCKNMQLLLRVIYLKKRKSLCNYFYRYSLCTSKQDFVSQLALYRCRYLPNNRPFYIVSASQCWLNKMYRAAWLSFYWEELEACLLVMPVWHDLHLNLPLSSLRGPAVISTEGIQSLVKQLD